MSDIPHGFMRLAEPDTDDKYYEVTYNTSTVTEEIVPHRHYEDKFFLNDDFFQIHLDKPKFKELLNNYTFVLKYTGRRWYGQIKPAGVDAKLFDEAEFHGFWSRTFAGVGVDDNSTVIISAPTAAGTPVGSECNTLLESSSHYLVLSLCSQTPILLANDFKSAVDFYEMRRRNKAFEDDAFNYDYSPFGVLIPLTGYEGSGFFHCNK